MRWEDDIDDRGREGGKSKNSTCGMSNSKGNLQAAAAAAAVVHGTVVNLDSLLLLKRCSLQFFLVLFQQSEWERNRVCWSQDVAVFSSRP